MHVLDNDEFWKVYVREVRDKKSWKCDFARDVLWKNLADDTKMYSDHKLFRERRQKIENWLDHEDEWVETILGASKEIARREFGPCTEELDRYGLADALCYYVCHLDYFDRVARLMDAADESVTVTAQNNCHIHDVDKLDPLMLAGYSERLTDNKKTLLYKACVRRHVATNPHHQEHDLWRQQDEDEQQQQEMALREMVCDKVSRNFLERFEESECPAMWDVDPVFYEGLPDQWLAKAHEISQKMKTSSCS